MRCEICGETINGTPLKTKIDGSVMDVCENCAKFGRIQKTPAVRKPISNIKSKNPQKSNISRPNTNQRRNEPTEELVEEYDSIIREKREHLRLSREDLSKKLNEKASVLSRIENGKMIPDLKLAKKLENILKIDLIEKVNDFDLESMKNNMSSTPTLGDIVKIKKK
ncbi:multiprotein bridging factor aMBF1 [Methanobrevibacter filiformis]|uniref:Transcription factor n=1 Tax=Methanobrevibacter filiformis TaxID=55758 RepID=A0A166BKX8_9EURY|nr:multiprotein bridging factor aMBF1 [Methanobrevibacter filiformis]KZX13503.1 transcription factor [Methanobrevibacter filiformis]